MSDASILGEVSDLKVKLDSAISKEDPEAIVRVLRSIHTLNIPVDVLKKTRVGVPITKLKKRVEWPVVSKLAGDVISKFTGGLSSSGGSLSSSGSSSTPILSATRTNSSSSSSSSSSASSPKVQTTPKKSPAASPAPAVPAVIYVAGDTMRNSICRLIDRGIAEHATAGLETKDIAIEIEACLFQKNNCKTETAYKDRGRIIANNLKTNKELSLQVIEGSLTSEQLCSMSPEEMMPEEVKKKFDQMRKEINQELADEVAQTSGPSGSLTDAFRCSRCHKNETRYFEMQTRSADEPMTIFITCVNCGKRWKQ